MSTLNTLLLLLSVNTVILIAIFFRTRRYQLLVPGDIVLYRNPYDPEFMNMVTIVLHVHIGAGSVTIRGQGTTVTISRRWLRRVDVEPNYPLLVPEEPSEGICECRESSDDTPGIWNKARFRKVPLSWFPYILSCQKPPFGSKS